MPLPSPPPPPGAAERRRADRLELLAHIELRRGGGEVVLLPVINISAGGVFLRIDDGMLRGMRVGDPVGVFLDCGGEVTLDVDAEVVRMDLMGGPDRPAGIALMWASSDPSFSENLTAALRRFAAL
jgi:hypothetical protein